MSKKLLVLLAVALFVLAFQAGRFYELLSFCKPIIEQYANYNTVLHNELAALATHYDNAQKKAWALEAELAYYKPSYERLEAAYDYLLEHPVVEEVEVVKEVVKEVPLEPRYFESTIELREWLAQNDVDHHLYLTGGQSFEDYDCDDYARALSEQAIRDGYWVYVQYRPGHMLNSTIIGNKFYYIEPQKDKYWIACSLD